MHQQDLALPKTYKVRWGWATFSLIIYVLEILCLLVFLIAVLYLILLGGLNVVLVACVIAVVGIPFGLWTWRMVRFIKIRLELTPQGVTLYGYDYACYTPWNNVVGIGTQQRGFRRMKGLQLAWPMTRGKLNIGQTQNVPVVQLSWSAWFWPPHYNSILVIPPMVASGQWDQEELGAYVRRYAPQAFGGQPVYGYGQPPFVTNL